MSPDNSRRPTWQEVSSRLQSSAQEDVLISQERSFPEILAGFILHKTGVIPMWDSLQHPLVLPPRAVDNKLREASLVLFGDHVQNPSLLRDVIENSTLEGRSKSSLMEFVNLLEHYKSKGTSRNTVSNWREAREHIVKHGDSHQLRLHDFFMMVREANYQNPDIAYTQSLITLDRYFDRIKKGVAKLDDINLEISVIKSVGNEPDKINQASFRFHPRKIIYLADRHFIVVVGGPPNSGKSTFSASLYNEIMGLIDLCTLWGIIGKDDIKIGFSDLDRASPTSQSVMDNKKVMRELRRPWDTGMAMRAHRLLTEMGATNNVTLGDLPGQPSYITSILSQDASHSIIVKRSEDSSGNEWRNFFLSLPRQTNLIRVNTRYGEEDRSSGIGNYRSFSMGDNENLLFGRVVDLERRVIIDNPFIKFAAHTLLLDFLPGEVIREHDRYRMDYDSLRGIVYPKNTVIV